MAEEERKTEPVQAENGPESMDAPVPEPPRKKTAAKPRRSTARGRFGSVRTRTQRFPGRKERRNGKRRRDRPDGTRSRHKRNRPASGRKEQDSQGG